MKDQEQAQGSANQYAHTKFIDKSKNANTTKATNLWLRCYQHWAASKNKETNPERLSPVELDQHLQYFFAEVKKQDGDDYEPSSLSALQSGIDRHLKEQNYPASIITSREFMSSRSVLEGKARMIRESGKGKKPNRADVLTVEEEETLWECGQFGFHSPSSMINTLWWYLTQHFDLRGRQEH